MAASRCYNCTVRRWRALLNAQRCLLASVRGLVSVRAPNRLLTGSTRTATMLDNISGYTLIGYRLLVGMAAWELINMLMSRHIHNLSRHCKPVHQCQCQCAPHSRAAKVWRQFLGPRSQKYRSSFLLYGFLIGHVLLYAHRPRKWPAKYQTNNQNEPTRRREAAAAPVMLVTGL
jgi:hypothetical protein